MNVRRLAQNQFPIAAAHSSARINTRANLKTAHACAESPYFARCVRPGSVRKREGWVRARPQIVFNRIDANCFRANDYLGGAWLRIESIFQPQDFRPAELMHAYGFHA